VLKRTLTITVALAAVFYAAPAEAAVPPSFVGVVADGPIFNPSVNVSQEFDLMVGAGVQSVRAQFSWQMAQPYPDWASVPSGQASRFVDEGGIPTDWSRPDKVVAAAAARHMSVLPVITTSPAWAAVPPSTLASPPRSAAAFAKFAATAARRYGPGGAFWAQHPELEAQPIRDWQIWNEPSFRAFWRPRKWVRPYVALLRAARASLKAVDPGARIVLGGLPGISWKDIGRIYHAGGRDLFDVAAIHPFTSRVSGAVQILRNVEAVMRKFHDGSKPVWVTEMTWPSSRGHTTTNFGYEVTQRGQAQKLASAFRDLAALRGRLRIERVYWYTWIGLDRRRDYPFDFSGVSTFHDGSVTRKPALDALRRTALALEGCRAKAGRADVCG
jgi:hypothetical protein